MGNFTPEAEKHRTVRQQIVMGDDVGDIYLCAKFGPIGLTKTLYSCLSCADLKHSATLLFNVIDPLIVLSFYEISQFLFGHTQSATCAYRSFAVL